MSMKTLDNYSNTFVLQLPAPKMNPILVAFGNISVRLCPTPLAEEQSLILGSRALNSLLL